MYSRERIKVMISSRCNDPVELGGAMVKFSDLRHRIKTKVESEELLGGKLFECWINEDAPPAEGSQDSWNTCLGQVRRADLLLVLYNGNAGWARAAGDIGICHAELEAGLSSGAAKVRLVALPPVTTNARTAEGKRNRRFQEFVNRQNLFRGTEARTGEKAVVVVLEALHDAVIRMVKLGNREARKGKYDSGEALDWSRLDFARRKEVTEGILRDALLGQPAAHAAGDHVVVTLGGSPVLLCCHAVPAAMSVAAAREMVGRPFLRDHELDADLGRAHLGPVHLIACHKGVTEKQATDLLGFADATLVTPGFGVYVADNVQKVQLLLLAECRDETTTRHAVQRAMDWLESSGEERYLAERAKARRAIIRTIAEQLTTGST